MKFTSTGLFLLSAFFCYSPSLAQNQLPSYSIGDRYVSSAGLTYSWIPASERTKAYYGICYSPSLNIINQFSDFSFAAASHMSAGYHPASAGETGGHMTYSIPVYARFNFGHLSTHDFFSSYGIFLGAGYHFSFINSDPDRGALLITAFRFWISKLSFTAGYAHFKLAASHGVMHQVSLQLNLGAYLSDAKKNNKLSKFAKPFRK